MQTENRTNGHAAPKTRTLAAVLGRPVPTDLPAQNLFRLGQTLITPGVRESLNHKEILRALHRHARGDWAHCDEEDRAANDLALIEETRILSVSSTASGVKFWIITEADRSATTVLLPDEY